MQRSKMNDLLEKCLAQLHGGAGLEDVLAQHQPEADELRPLLELALLAQPLSAEPHDLATAMNRSRARFLGAAHQRIEAAPRPGRVKLAGLRVARAVTLAAMVLIVSLVGSGLASAKAVPGQALYPVKRAVEQAQMALTTNQANRIELEESFDQRRANEAETLIHSGQTEKVEFAGVLRKDPSGWIVDQSLLILTPVQEELVSSLEGSYVVVEGVVQGEAGVEVKKLELRLFYLSGVLQSVQPDAWVVDGVQVAVQASTKITGNVQTGARVEITALRISDGHLLALSAKVKNKGAVKIDKNDAKDSNNSNDGENPELNPTATHESEEGHEKGKPTEEPHNTPEHDNDSRSTPEPSEVTD